MAKNSPSGHHCTTLSGYIFATKANIDNQKQNLLNSNIFSICPHNMGNFGPLAAEICWRVWGTSAHFHGFSPLGRVTEWHSVVSVSQTAALNRGHHLYSAGRPSRWALVHILVCFYVIPILTIYTPYDHMTRFHARKCLLGVAMRLLPI